MDIQDTNKLLEIFRNNNISPNHYVNINKYNTRPVSTNTCTKRFIQKRHKFRIKDYDYTILYTNIHRENDSTIRKHIILEIKDKDGCLFYMFGKMCHCYSPNNRRTGCTIIYSHCFNDIINSIKTICNDLPVNTLDYLKTYSKLISIDNIKKNLLQLYKEKVIHFVSEKYKDDVDFLQHFISSFIIDINYDYTTPTRINWWVEGDLEQILCKVSDRSVFFNIRYDKAYIDKQTFDNRKQLKEFVEKLKTTDYYITDNYLTLKEVVREYI